LDISGDHSNFHEGHRTVGEWQWQGMAGERHGNGMGESRAQHSLCELDLTVHLCAALWIYMYKNDTNF
jgi:hypothetical protein